MFKEPRGIQPLIHNGSDDLESFLAWSEQIKLDMSESNPLLYQVLGNLAFSKQPIAGGDSFQTKAGQASFLEPKSHQPSGEDRAKEARELQIRNEGRQLVCLLVQRTKGETQLRVTKWLAATNGWEAWRQVNLTFLSKLLDSLLHLSFDESPASCLQQLSAWKERVMLYQKLSGEQLPESVMMSVVMILMEMAALVILNTFWPHTLQNKSLENTTEWTTKQTTAFNNKNKTSLTSLSKEAKEKEKKKGELTIPSLHPTKARGSLTSSRQCAQSLQGQARRRKGQDRP